MKVRILGALLLLSLLASFSIAQTAQKTVIQDIAWTPDGSAIYFSAMRVNVDFSDFKPELWSVYKYEIGSGSAREIVSAAYTVTVSPDGKRLAVGKYLFGGQDIYICDNEGRNLSRLTTHSAQDSAPSWSPDGTSIAFNSMRTGNVEIFTVNPDGTGLTQITRSKHKSYNPQWSPDGSMIAFYLEKGDGKDQIYTVEPGNKPVQRTDDEFNNIFPGWASEELIVYGRGKRGEPTLTYTVSLEDGIQGQVMDLESFYARISPTIDWLAYVDSEEGVIKIRNSIDLNIITVRIPDAQ